MKRTSSNISISGLRGSNNVADTDNLKEFPSQQNTEKDKHSISDSGIREPEESSSESENESGVDEGEERDNSSSSQPTETIPGAKFSSPRKTSLPSTPIGSVVQTRAAVVINVDTEGDDEPLARRLSYSSDEPQNEPAQIKEPDSPAEISSAYESAEEPTKQLQTIETVVEKKMISTIELSDDDLILTTTRKSTRAVKSSQVSPKKAVKAVKSSETPQKKTKSKSEETKEEKKERLKKTEEEIKRRRKAREAERDGKGKEPDSEEEIFQTKDEKKSQKKTVKEEKPKKISAKAKKEIEKQKEKERKEFEAKENSKKSGKEEVMLKVTPRKRKTPTKKEMMLKKKMKTDNSSSSEDENNNNEGAEGQDYVHNPAGLAHGGRRRKTWEDQARFARIDFSKKKEADPKLSSIFASPFALMSENKSTNNDVTVVPSAKKKGRVQNKTRGVPLVVDSLQTMCLKLLVKYIDCVESFGLLPPVLQDAMCALLARHSKFTPAVLDLFLEPDMSVLHLSNCSELDPKTLSTVAHCRQLEKLTIAGCGKLTNEALDVISDHCKMIKEIRLDGCYRIGDSSLTHLVQTHPKLELLSLGWIEKFTHSFTEALGSACVGLRHLSLIQCVNVNDVTLAPLAFLPKLESITLEGMPQITDAGISKVILASKDSMKRINIIRCDQITAAGVASIVTQCTKLAHLNIEDVSDFDDENMLKIAAECNSLESFRIWGSQNFNEISAIELVQKNPQLTKIAICKNLNVGINFIQEMCKSCPNVQELDLSWSRMTDDFVIEHILLKLHRLRKVVLWGCFKVTDLAVKVILKHGVEVIGKDQFTLL